MTPKKRILLCNEASYLSTGFSTYGLEVMKRLHATGKYELAELASYGPFGDERALELPWDSYSVMPDVRDEGEVQEYNSKATNQFGEWKFEQTCVDFQPDIVWDVRDHWMFEFEGRSPFRPYFHWAIMPTVDACFVAGTPLVTKDGLKDIQDAREGDIVVSHDGSFNTVTKLWEKNWTAELVTIDACGPVLPITMTCDHPVLVVKYRGQKWTHTSRLHRSVNHSFADAEFVPASEVNVGDYLIVPRPDDEPNEPLDLTDWLDGVAYKEQDGYIVNRSTSPRLPRWITLTTDVAGFFGLYVAEGSVNHRNWEMRISMCRSKEQAELDFAERVIRETFGCQTARLPRENEDTEEVAFYGCLLARFLSSSCGPNAAEKKVPDFIVNADESITVPFLEKLFLGDGSDTNSPHGHRVLSFVTKSRTLAYQVGRMLLRLGCLSSLGSNGGTYQVTVCNSHGRRLASLFGWERPGIEFSNFDNSKSWIDADSGHALVRVKAVTKFAVPEGVKVYNITIENKKTYCVGFAVHNCPQDEAWLATFQEADGVFAYSDWGLDVLKNQGQGRLNTFCSAPPGADIETLRPTPDKRTHKRQMGLPDDCLVVGTIMRNQKRKLYPELIESFARFVRQAPDELARRAYLYLHVSYPDVGWDIPRLIKEAGIGSKTLFTYACLSCGVSFPSFYMDAKAYCRRCGAQNASLPNSQRGVPRNVLGNVLNFMDVYVQYANSEGFGMPQVEAAACGVPVMAVDYSAMSDVVRKLKGFPIKVLTLVRECETGCFRAVPDNDDFVHQLIRFLSLPEGIRLKRGFDARLAVENHYNYDKTAKIWEDYFDAIPVRDRKTTWHAPARIHNPPAAMPQGLSDEEFIRWGITQVAGRPELANSYLALRMIRDLTWNLTLGNVPKSVFSEFALLGTHYRPQPFNREKAGQEFIQMCQHRNFWEEQRANAPRR